MKSDQTTIERDAESKLFPEALPPTTTSDVLAQYRFMVERLAPLGYGDKLAAHHARALGANETLAALMRCFAAIEDVGEAALQTVRPADGEPISVTQARAASASIAAYKRAIAEQLAATPSHALAKVARVYLDAVATSERAEAEQRRQADLIAAEQARLEAARREEAERDRERRAAELRESEAAAKTAEKAAEISRENYRVARAKRLVAELEVCGVAQLRIPSGPSRGKYSVRDLILAAPSMGLEQLAAVEQALSDVLEAAEDQAS